MMQAAAVSSAMGAFNREVLRAHLKSCVIRDIREGKDEVADELMDTLRIIQPRLYNVVMDRLA